MKTLEETFKDIQESINQIKDEEVRKKAQAEFDALPKDPEKWVIDGACGSDIKFKNPASATPEEIEREYVEHEIIKIKKFYDCDSMHVKVKVDPKTKEREYQLWAHKNLEKYYGPDVAHEEYASEEDHWVESIRSSDVAFLVGYRCMGAYVNSYGKNFRATELRTNKLENEKQESFSISESTNLGKSEIKIRETSQKRSFGSKLTEVNTRLEDGEIVEINGQKTKTDENQNTKIIEINTKKVGNNEFETTRKTSETVVLTNTKERGVLKEGESISLSKEGEVVQEMVAGV